MKKMTCTRRWVLFLLLMWAGSGQVVIAEEPALRIGIFPRFNYTETLRRYTPLSEYLSKQLGRPVELETAADFPSFWKKVEERRFDIVHFNQYHYLKARRELKYEVIATNREAGSDTISGAILVRRDSGIKHLKDLKGKRILFGGGRDAMQAYILTTSLLRHAGLKPGDYEEHFAVNPPNAVIATFQGHADAAGAGDQVLKMRIISERIDAAKMMVLAASEPAVHLPWAVKAELPAPLKQQIQHLLMTLTDHPTGVAVLNAAKLDGFGPAADRDFNPLRRIVFEVSGEKF